MQSNLRLSILFSSIVLAVAPAYSTTITTYSSFSNWAAATSPDYQTVTFEGLAPSGGVSNYYGPGGVTQDGVEFIGYNDVGQSDIQVVDTSAFPWYNWGSGDALLQGTQQVTSSSPLPYISIVLPSNVTALGLNLFSTNNQGMTYSINVAGNQYDVPTSSQPTLAFWGITSSAPISSVTLALEGTVWNNPSEMLVDNFSFGTSDLAVAPEADTYLLIGSGLIGLIAIRKRLTSHKTDPR